MGLGILERKGAKNITAFPRLEDHEAVIAARDAVRHAREPWNATKATVDRLKAELDDPAKTRGDLRIRVDIEDAIIAHQGAEVRLKAAVAAQREIEERVIREDIEPVYRDAMTSLIIRLDTALRPAENINAELRSLHEQAEHAGIRGRSPLTWSDLQNGRLSNWRAFVAQETGIAMEAS